MNRHNFAHVRTSWIQALGGSRFTSAFVHRCLMLQTAATSSSSSVALLSSCDSALPAATPIAVIELDQPSVLCAADSGEIPGVYATALLSSSSSSSLSSVLAPRPAELLQHQLARASDEFQQMFFDFLRSIATSTTVKNSETLVVAVDGVRQSKRTDEDLAYLLRQFWLASAISTSAATSPPFLAEAFNSIRGKNKIRSDDKVAAAYSSLLLFDTSPDFSLPPLSPLLAAWQLINSRGLRLHVAGDNSNNTNNTNNVFPCLVPLISSHLIQQMSVGSDKNSGGTAWKAFSAKRPAVKCAVTVEKSLAGTINNDLVFLGRSSHTNAASSSSSERYFFVVRTTEEVPQNCAVEVSL